MELLERWIRKPRLEGRRAIGHRCHTSVMRIVMNGGKSRQKLKREDESWLAPFDQNLLISLDLSRLRQIVIKLVSRLLTEMLEVRILPGEPTPLSYSELRTFSGNPALPR